PGWEGRAPRRSPPAGPARRPPDLHLPRAPRPAGAAARWRRPPRAGQPHESRVRGTRRATRPRTPTFSSPRPALQGPLAVQPLEVVEDQLPYPRAERPQLLAVRQAIRHHPELGRVQRAHLRPLERPRRLGLALFRELLLLQRAARIQQPVEEA